MAGLYFVALGQAVAHGGGPEARRLLEDRLGLESDAVVRGAIYRTLGRLAIATQDERDRTERLLIRDARIGDRRCRSRMFIQLSRPNARSSESSTNQLARAARTIASCLLSTGGVTLSWRHREKPQPASASNHPARARPVPSPFPILRQSRWRTRRRQG